MSSKWQPIETAPRDGTRILAWNSEYGQRETYMSMYSKGSVGYERWVRGNGPAEIGWDWQEPMNGWAFTWKPTHWMPLPEAPETSE